MTSEPTIFLVADDDRDHVTCIRDLMTAAAPALTATLHSPRDTAVYLDSLVTHNPTRVPLRCVLLLGFAQVENSLAVLQWLQAQPLARPHGIVLLVPAHGVAAHLDTPGVDAVLARYASAADLRAAVAAALSHDRVPVPCG